MNWCLHSKVKLSWTTPNGKLFFGGNNKLFQVTHFLFKSLEAARHCRWVDEVVAEAPWFVTEDFIKRYEIDYVAHDEEAYASAGHDDVYTYVKSQGKKNKWSVVFHQNNNNNSLLPTTHKTGRFLPTRRTPCISTSDILRRVIAGYRNCVFDDKLTKMGHSELRADGSYDDDSQRASPT